MNIIYTNQFKKDYKRVVKQNKNPEDLKKIIGKLAAGKKLHHKYNDHKLSGNWKGYRDCHIKPDWLMIYEWGQTLISDYYLTIITNQGRCRKLICIWSITEKLKPS